MSLSELSDISQVIIAGANLALAFYLFFYQKSKDQKSEIAAAKLNEQNIKLQWFKELIIQPKQKKIDAFYKNVSSIRGMIKSNDLSEDEKLKINESVKNQAKIFRKEFIEGLFLIDYNFANAIQTIVDEDLVDPITNVIFDDTLKLNRDEVYQKYIGDVIDKAYHKIIASIYNYKAI